MSRAWTKADAWYRRDAGGGFYLTASRNRAGSWSWRLDKREGRRVIAYATGFSCAIEAMIDADADEMVRYVRPRRAAA